MVKTFFKKKPPKKVFFTTGLKMRSYAYGEEISREFIDWRKRFLAKWNSPKTSFWLMENGPIDGNFAKIEKSGELRVAEPNATHRCIIKKPTEICPLWLERYYIELGEYGEIIINGNHTERFLGSGIKAWGIGVCWKNKQPIYNLYVFRNTEQETAELSAYNINTNDNCMTTFVCTYALKPTLSKKCHIYCFGSHIFLISESKMNYYYHNQALSRFEEVALGDDEPNEDKPFCNNVTGPVVCDSDGYVYWYCGNYVYFFKIGYPRRIGGIDVGQSNDITGIQAFRERLFVYYKSRIAREYTCLSFYIKDGDVKDKTVFNRGSKYNLFFAEKNCLLHYVKFPSVSRKGIVAKKNMDKEIAISEIDIAVSEQMFCVNGDLYLNCSYIGAAQFD